MQLSIGLEYVNAVFQTLKESDFAEYTILGMKTLAVLFFLVNIIKKYYEGAASSEGYTWGLTPGELIKNFVVVLAVIFSTEILSYLDSILVAIEMEYRNTAPDLIPLQFQDLELEEDINFVEAGTKALSLLYEYMITPLYPMKVIAFILGVFLWLMDLLIYPLFLAERFFLLGLMQAFFPLVISLAVFEKFRDLGYRFFKLYAAVYMIVPAFFLVNVFVNLLYEELTTNFWENLVGEGSGSGIFEPLVQLASVGFIVLLKFKLYRQAISFTMRIFTS